MTYVVGNDQAIRRQQVAAKDRFDVVDVPALVGINEDEIVLPLELLQALARRCLNNRDLIRNTVLCECLLCILGVPAS